MSNTRLKRFLFVYFSKRKKFPVSVKVARSESLTKPLTKVMTQWIFNKVACGTWTYYTGKRFNDSYRSRRKIKCKK